MSGAAVLTLFATWAVLWAGFALIDWLDDRARRREHDAQVRAYRGY